MSDPSRLMWLKIKELRPELVRFRTRPKKALTIFVSGKYTTGGSKENIAKAVEAGIAIIKKGHVPIIPHTMFCGVDSFISYNEIMDCCIDLIQNRCDAVLFLDDWEESNGAKIEFLAANTFWRTTYFGIDDIPNVK